MEKKDQVEEIWETIQEEMLKETPREQAIAIPMANGGVCHG